METLKQLTDEFMQIEKDILSHKNGNKIKNYHHIIHLTHKLIYEISSLKEHYNKNSILAELNTLRSIHAKSPFIKRLQEWPLGYPGDYMTVEQICNLDNQAEVDTLAHTLEDYALNSLIAQQHRNKIHIQSLNILKKIVSVPNCKVLIYACGGAYDLREIQDIIQSRDNYHIILNDLDPNALAFAKENLKEEIVEHIEFVNENIIAHVKNIAEEKEEYDLILFGGIFDYLTDKQIKFVLSNSYNNLKTKGKIIFTNINCNNPFASWIEYLGNWKLIERSQTKNLEICQNSNIPQNNISQYMDDTNLTNIVEIKKGVLR